MTQRDVAGIYIDGLPWKLSFDSKQFIQFTVHLLYTLWNMPMSTHIYTHSKHTLYTMTLGLFFLRSTII